MLRLGKTQSLSGSVTRRTPTSTGPSSFAASSNGSRGTRVGGPQIRFQDGSTTPKSRRNDRFWGTFRTCLPKLTMSVHWGRADFAV